jgi:hypothetical protein
VERIPVGSLPAGPVVGFDSIWVAMWDVWRNCDKPSAPDTHSTNRVRTRAAVPSRDRYQRHRRRPRHAVDD